MGRMAYAVGRASRGGWGLTGTAPHAMPRTRSRPERGRQGHPLREGWIRTGPEQADTAIHAGRLMPGNARRKPDAKRAGGRQGHPLPEAGPIRNGSGAGRLRRLTPGNSRRAAHTGQRTLLAGREAGRRQAGSPAPGRLARYGTGLEQAGCGDSRRTIHAGRLTSQAGREAGRGQAGSPAPGGWPDTKRVRSRQAAATHAGQFTPQAGRGAGRVTRSRRLARYGTGPEQAGCGDSRRATHAGQFTPQAGREAGRGQARSPAPGGWPDTERVRSRQPGSPP